MSEISNNWLMKRRTKMGPPFTEAREVFISMNETVFIPFSVHSFYQNETAAMNGYQPYPKLFPLGMGVFRCNPTRGFLLDITDVLYNSSPNTLGIAIPGLIDAINGKSCTICGNESNESRGDLTRKLKKIGFNLKEEYIFTPSAAAIEYLKQHALKPHLLVHQGALKEFAEMSNGEPNCVVMGDAEYNFTYDAMNEAFRVLTTLDDLFIITPGFGFYQRVDGPCLDVGGFTKALQYATDARIATIGKPAESFFLAAIKDMGLSRDEVVMMGDDIISDTGGAMKVGIRAVQLRSGKWRPEWGKHLIKPNLIANNLMEAVNILLRYHV